MTSRSEFRRRSISAPKRSGAVAFRERFRVITGAIFDVVNSLGVALFKKNAPPLPDAPGRIDVWPPE